MCNHPYLVEGSEDQICENITDSDPAELAALFISCSGKFVLLDKLLPKLQAGGHRVLIFSQMVRVLDLLADYLRFRHYHFERLDGGIRGHDRQVRAYVRCELSIVVCFLHAEFEQNRARYSTLARAGVAWARGMRGWLLH